MIISHFVGIIKCCAKGVLEWCKLPYLYFLNFNFNCVLAKSRENMGLYARKVGVLRTFSMHMSALRIGGYGSELQSLTSSF